VIGPQFLHRRHGRSSFSHGDLRSIRSALFVGAQLAACSAECLIRDKIALPPIGIVEPARPKK
jgi:hypothetical protein